MEKWRDELRKMMRAAGFRRTPVLRRSKKEDFLFATDYPLASDASSVQAFITAAQKAGWRTETDSGWIQLDRKAEFEAADMPPAWNPEAGCCLSILERSAYEKIPSDGYAERLILKALEEGPDAYENVCGKLHADWAAAMREHTGIPDVDRRFFGGVGGL